MKDFSGVHRTSLKNFHLPMENLPSNTMDNIFVDIMEELPGDIVKEFSGDPSHEKTSR